MFGAALIMSVLSPVSAALLPGDVARRYAKIAACVCVVGIMTSFGLFSNVAALWAEISPLSGTVFMLKAALFGFALAVASLGAILGFLAMVWFGVESVYRPRTVQTPGLDRLITLFGLIVWFGPTLAMLAASVEALYMGRVHFSRPPRDYFMATDPVAFWQGVGFWIIMSAVLGFLAWHYWRKKLLRSRD